MVKRSKSRKMPVILSSSDDELDDADAVNIAAEAIQKATEAPCCVAFTNMVREVEAPSFTEIVEESESTMKSSSTRPPTRSPSFTAEQHKDIFESNASPVELTSQQTINIKRRLNSAPALFGKEASNTSFNSAKFPYVTWSGYDVGMGNDLSDTDMDERNEDSSEDIDLATINRLSRASMMSLDSNSRATAQHSAQSTAASSTLLQATLSFDFCNLITATILLFCMVAIITLSISAHTCPLNAKDQVVSDYCTKFRQKFK